ncbi:NAD(P)-dependent oxidoreductase [Bacteroidota bacterium]
MCKKIKLGILKETKVPIDRRVPLIPTQTKLLLEKFSNLEIFVQPSEIRCYSDNEYRELGIELKNDLSDCDILIGVKEVDVTKFIKGKTYLFFSHTTKKQEYNRSLLQEIIRKKISLIDYEHLTNANNIRLVAFGYWAGIVGAYNGIIGWGLRTKSFSLKPAHKCRDMEEMFKELQNANLKNIKILITGGGRVAHGAMKTLKALNIRKISPDDFLNNKFNEAVYSQIDPDYYVRRNDGEKFELNHFINNPADYQSIFSAFTKVADLYIPCHFWDKRSPAFMTIEDMKAPDFNIKLIADISCDIRGPIPSTIRSSSIDSPFYGFDPYTGEETEAFGSEKNISVMAVDNLPGELARDASLDFGNKLIEEIFPSLFGEDHNEIIKRATIVKSGKLTEKYFYLQSFADGK